MHLTWSEDIIGTSKHAEHSRIHARRRECGERILQQYVYILTRSRRFLHVERKEERMLG